MNTISKIDNINGELSFRGDKSISHRAVIFAALANGKSILKNCSGGADVKSTIAIFRQLGARITYKGSDIIIDGRGFRNLFPPDSYLDAGNSGTTSRLMAGILPHQEFSSVIIGDESLSKRPMKRVSEPLKQMGANITLSSSDCLPMYFFPQGKMHAIEYKLPVASAQVKSAVLLSGLFLDEITTVIETEQTRNHTETMLGLPVKKTSRGTEIQVSKLYYPAPAEYDIPGDISSASFFIALAVILPHSELLLRNVSLNPSRRAFPDIITAMGGSIEIVNLKASNGELRGDLLVRSSQLKNVDIPAEVIPNIIDELPALAICGLFAAGRFTVRNAKELRVKESDRISALVQNLTAAGVDVEEFEDGFSFEAPQNGLTSTPSFRSFDDHRIAMAFSILSFLLKDGGKIDNLECIKISNPDFFDDIKKLTGK